MKEWRLRQTRATREANAGAAAGGGQAAAPSSKSVSRDKQFERVLANDPIFAKVASSRGKKGPSRPITDALDSRRLMKLSRNTMDCRNRRWLVRNPSAKVSVTFFGEAPGPAFLIVVNHLGKRSRSAKVGATALARGLAGKPLAGFCTTPSRRITAVFGVIVYAIRFKTPSLHR